MAEHYRFTRHGGEERCCPAPSWKEIRLGSGVVLKRSILDPKYLVGGFFFHHIVGKASATQTADVVESVSR